jgi:hypothetical protein
MKKVLLSILAIVYLSTSMGATVRLHYCMGRLVSWGLTEHAGKSCGLCGMQKMPASGDCSMEAKSCCHEESMHVKNDKDQQSAQEVIRVITAPSALAELPQPVWPDAVIASPVKDQPLSHRPPLVDLLPVYLRNCNLRI